MAVVYATLIIKGKKTMEQVPERLKADVAEILEACEVALVIFSKRSSLWCACFAEDSTAAIRSAISKY